ncbi:hypothetical protein [Chitinophaga sp. YIM B06452]|uniref:hypothetical protein n=1 Tax=Chitinophaga sp. YIM B06452 TaxID=3082158 RepID=UPI0031FEEE22
MISNRELFLQQSEPMQEEQYINEINTINMQQQALSYIGMDILPTKSNIQKLAENLADIVRSGANDAFEVVAKLEATKSLCESSRKLIEPLVREELEKYGKEGLTKLEAKFELAEVGVKYDYSSDPVWQALSEKIAPLQEALKEREKLLKAITKPLIETDPDTGETYKVFPPIKTSTSSFKVTLGK